MGIYRTKDEVQSDTTHRTLPSFINRRQAACDPEAYKLPPRDGPALKRQFYWTSSLHGTIIRGLKLWTSSTDFL